MYTIVSIYIYTYNIRTYTHQLSLLQVETHRGPLILISRSWVVRLGGVSGCDVSLGLGLEVSWERVGMDVGGAQSEGEERRRPKKSIFER